MKHLFALFLLSVCWLSGQADSLPTNQEDKPKDTEAVVYPAFGGLICLSPTKTAPMY